MLQTHVAVLARLEIGLIPPAVCMQRFVMQPEMPVETALRVYRRYLKLEPSHTEEYIAYLKSKVDHVIEPDRSVTPCAHVQLHELKYAQGYSKLLQCDGQWHLNSNGSLSAVHHPKPNSSSEHLHTLW